jgi:myosin heavy subunit
MCLLGDDIYKYHYVSQGKVTVPSIDDNEEFAATHEAFEILLFTEDERSNIYRSKTFLVAKSIIFIYLPINNLQLFCSFCRCNAHG